jgi:hypothetical protein
MIKITNVLVATDISAIQPDALVATGTVKL